MPRFLIIFVLLAGLAAGGWYVAQKYNLPGIEQLGIFPGRAPAGAGVPVAPAPAPKVPSRQTFRLAVLNLETLDANKLAQPRVREVLGQVLARFDLIAIPDMRAGNQGLLVRLIEQAQAVSKRSFDYAAPQTVQLEAVERYAAFVFDRSIIEVDRSMVFAVADPARHFRCKPLVGVFRAKGPSAAEAFTFTLVAVASDPRRPNEEAELLDDVYRAVRDDGRNEDDVLMLGTFNLEEHPLRQLEESLNLVHVVEGVPTTTRGTLCADNILLSRRATAEFTGRWGVVDLVREFNLTIQEAVEITEHLPVWLECSVYEGGQPGHVPGATPTN